MTVSDYLATLVYSDLGLPLPPATQPADQAPAPPQRVTAPGTPEVDGKKKPPSGGRGCSPLRGAHAQTDNFISVVTASWLAPPSRTTSPTGDDDITTSSGRSSTPIRRVSRHS